MQERDILKTLILAADDAKDADRIIEKYTVHHELGEKYGFISGLFGVEILFKSDFGDKEGDYWVMLGVIVGRKWR